MNELKIFNNPEFGEVRTLEENGKILFCGSDVAKALGYKDTVNALKQHCKKDGVAFHHLTDSLGRQQETKFVNESNMYRLIVNSKLSSAEKFESWVFDEVLPSIRKNGAYMTPETIESVLNNPDTIIMLATRLKETQTQISKQQQIIGELKPMADYCDRILKSKGTIPISPIAKDYGMSARTMNKLLHDLSVQYRQGEVWLLYAKFQSKGYTHSKIFDYNNSLGMPQTRLTMEWTQKGRMFLYYLLKDNGYLPLIEQDMPA